jgi:prevent-host-death family protein
METESTVPSYGARELRYQTREVLEHIIRGTHVEITRHGRVEAYLVPADWYREAFDAWPMPIEESE